MCSWFISLAGGNEFRCRLRGGAGVLAGYTDRVNAYLSTPSQELENGPNPSKRRWHAFAVESKC